MLQRFNSDPNSQPSTILGGNIFGIPGDLASVSDESDIESQESESDPEEQSEVTDEVTGFESQPVTEDQVKKADKLLYEVFGLNLISILVKMILNQQIHAKDFIIQGLAYKCQSLIRGKSGVRYLDSWGMFWAATRNLIKTRGLIPFYDHFVIPSKSQLVRFKSNVLKLCGLEKSKIGRPGIQSSVLELWFNSKSKENPGKTLAVSVNMDAKKIAVTPGEEGSEDMGDNERLKASEDTSQDVLKKMTHLINIGSRDALFSLYDQFSSFGQEIMMKNYASKVLLEVNTKRLEKNPSLSKYIYVLKTQICAGTDLLNSLGVIQCKIIHIIANLRNAGHLLPKAEMNLNEQDNYRILNDVTQEADATNLYLIDQHLKNEHLLDIQWPNLLSQLDETSNISRSSKTFSRLLNICFLRSDQIFKACGLSKTRPVQEMKDIYKNCHIFPSVASPLAPLSASLTYTFCSVMAPMSFGLNCKIKECGIVIRDGLASLPDMLVFSTDLMLKYCVSRYEIDKCVFEVELEMVAKAVVDSFITQSQNGTLVIQSSEELMVVFCVPTNNQLAEKMIGRILSKQLLNVSYDTNNVCYTF